MLNYIRAIKRETRVQREDLDAIPHILHQFTNIIVMVHFKLHFAQKVMVPFKMQCE